MGSNWKRYTLIAAALIIAAISGIGMAGEQSDAEKARAKARHYFMLSSRASAEGRHDAAYEYSRKATEADPGYSEAAWLHATNRLSANLDTLRSAAQLRKTLGMARQFVDEYPEDYNESLMYAYWATGMDTVPEAVRVYERLVERFPARSELLPDLSDAYVRLGRDREAVDVLDRFETAEGPSPQLALRKISIMLHLNDTTAALREADSLVRRSPSEPMMRVIRGNVYEFLGDTVSSLRNFLEAEQVAPTAAAPKLVLAQYYLGKGNTAMYDTKTYEAMMDEELQLDEKLELATQYLQRLVNDTTDTSGRGETLMESMRAQYPHEPKVLQLTAEYKYAIGDGDEAEELLSYALDLDAANAEAWRTLMGMYIRSRKYDDVVATFERGKGHITANETDRMMYAMALGNAGRVPEALGVYRGILGDIIPGVDVDAPVTDTKLRSLLGTENNTRVGNVLLIMGDMLHEAGRKDESYVKYDNSIFFNPLEPMAFNNYAYFIATDGGDLEKALGLSAKAVEMDSDNPTYLDTYAWVLHLLGRDEEAYGHQQHVIEKAGEGGEDVSAEFYDHMGDICHALGKGDEAVANWKKALELVPDDEKIQNKVKRRRVL